MAFKLILIRAEDKDHIVELLTSVKGSARTHMGKDNNERMNGEFSLYSGTMKFVHLSSTDEQQ